MEVNGITVNGLGEPLPWEKEEFEKQQTTTFTSSSGRFCTECKQPLVSDNPDQLACDPCKEAWYKNITRPRGRDGARHTLEHIQQKMFEWGMEAHDKRVKEERDNPLLQQARELWGPLN